MCVGARALRARSAALSKVIVRTEQNNFAGGGAVAGLVLRAPVEQMLWAPKTHHDIVKRSDPEKNPKRYPEQKRGKEPLTEESRNYRSLV